MQYTAIFTAVKKTIIFRVQIAICFLFLLSEEVLTSTHNLYDSQNKKIVNTHVNPSFTIKKWV